MCCSQECVLWQDWIGFQEYVWLQSNFGGIYGTLGLSRLALCLLPTFQGPLESRLLRFWSSFLLMQLGKQQTVVQVLGSHFSLA